MAIIKALLGGIIGGGVGALLSNMIPGHWPVLLAGLLAGLGVRLACGNQRNFMTGVVAAVAAILMVVGTSYYSSMATIRKAESFQPVLIQPVIDDEEEEEAEEVAEEEAGEEAGEEAAADDAGAETADEAEDVADDVEEAAAEVATVDISAAEGNAGHGSDTRVSLDGLPPAKKPDATELSTQEAVFHGLSALLAYLLGTGSAVAAVGQPSSSESSDDGDASVT